MVNENLFCALRHGFPANLEAIAVETDDGLCYSWLDLERGSAMMANWLRSLSLPEGSRIAVQVEKSVEVLMLYLATLRSGHVFLPLNPAYQANEMAYFMTNAEPAVVVCSPDRFSWVSKLAFQSGTASVVSLDHQRGGTLLQRAVHHSDQHTPVHRHAHDLAAIIYTSGTTGRSKGAMLSHGNLSSNASMLKDYWDWRAEDVLIHALPIFHVHGLFVAIHAALIGGSRMLWHSRFDPQKVMNDLPRASVLMGVPTFYTRLLASNDLTREHCQAMRLFISGSAPMLAETFEAWQTRTGHAVLERYGMSETVMLTSNPCVGDARHGGATERIGGSVGFPLPGVALRIVDEQLQSVATGEVGSIQVKGPGVFSGYWCMPERQAQDFTSDGFFITGDMGTVDHKGYVRIVGRSKDLIISGGLNVYPAEVENALNQLPGVAESAVVAVPHADFGEVGFAFVIAKPGAVLTCDALLSSLKQQLAAFKVPKHCLVVEELPRNTMGKVQKNLLRDLAKTAR
jgi:malonyl-CoA/methylmalonyl-CoA synthetase